MDDEVCPHCGSEDYGEIGGPNLPMVCLACGYDSESGTSGVCPGGKHPKDTGDICCDWCWDRAPRTLPIGPNGEKRPWRKRRAELKRRGHKSGNSSWTLWEKITDELLGWLREHPADPPPSTRR